MPKEQLERAIKALERIADALEAKSSPDFTTQGGGTGNGPPGNNGGPLGG